MWQYLLRIEANTIHALAPWVDHGLEARGRKELIDIVDSATSGVVLPTTSAITFVQRNITK